MAVLQQILQKFDELKQLAAEGGIQALAFDPTVRIIAGSIVCVLMLTLVLMQPIPDVDEPAKGAPEPPRCCCPPLPALPRLLQLPARPQPALCPTVQIAGLSTIAATPSACSLPLTALSQQRRCFFSFCLRMPPCPPLSAAPPKKREMRGYTRAEVAQHKSEGNLWLIIAHKETNKLQVGASHSLALPSTQCRHGPADPPCQPCPVIRSAARMAPPRTLAGVRREQLRGAPPRGGCHLHACGRRLHGGLPWAAAPAHSGGPGGRVLHRLGGGPMTHACGHIAKQQACCTCCKRLPGRPCGGVCPRSDLGDAA
jgi:hypothetical protein